MPVLPVILQDHVGGDLCPAGGGVVLASCKQLSKIGNAPDSPLCAGPHLKGQLHRPVAVLDGFIFFRADSAVQAFLQDFLGFLGAVFLVVAVPVVVYVPFFLCQPVIAVLAVVRLSDHIVLGMLPGVAQPMLCPVHIIDEPAQLAVSPELCHLPELRVIVLGIAVSHPGHFRFLLVPPCLIDFRFQLGNPAVNILIIRGISPYLVVFVIQRTPLPFQPSDLRLGLGNVHVPQSVQPGIGRHGLHKLTLFLIVCLSRNLIEPLFIQLSQRCQPP